MKPRYKEQYPHIFKPLIVEKVRQKLSIKIEF